MADILVKNPNDGGVVERFVDMGDGTFARKVAIGAGGTVTASTPVFNGTQTWNNVAVTFTGMKLNITDTASAADSLLMDLQVGGVSRFSIAKGTSSSGYLRLSTGGGSPQMLVANDAVGFMLTRQDGTGSYFDWSCRNFKAISTGLIGFWSGTAFNAGALDATLARKAAKVIEINSGTAGTYPGTALLLGTQTVAQLTAAATAGAGARATVSDATAPTFGATVAGGGAVVTPVYSDGTNWKVG